MPAGALLVGSRSARRRPATGRRRGRRGRRRGRALGGAVGRGGRAVGAGLVASAAGCVAVAGRVVAAASGPPTRGRRGRPGPRSDVRDARGRITVFLTVSGLPAQRRVGHFDSPTPAVACPDTVSASVRGPGAADHLDEGGRSGVRTATTRPSYAARPVGGVGVVALLLCLGAAACTSAADPRAVRASASSPSPSTSSASPEPVTLRFAVYGDPGRRRRLPRLAKAYTAEHPERHRQGGGPRRRGHVRGQRRPRLRRGHRPRTCS